VIHLSMWLAAVVTAVRLALRRLQRIRLLGQLVRVEVGIGLVALIGAAVGIAVVPLDASGSTYVWAGCITFLLGVLVERIIQTAASRQQDLVQEFAQGMTPGGEATSGAPPGTGPVIDADYTVVSAATDVIEPPQSVRDTRVRVKTTVEISSLAILAILLFFAQGRLQIFESSDPALGAAPGEERPSQVLAAVASPTATDGHAPEEVVDPFSGVRLRDGLWLATDSYFDGAHPLDDSGSVFERRSRGIDLQMRFMSYQDLLRVGGSLRDDLAQHRTTGRATAARSPATAWIKFRGPCWKRHAQWPDGHRLEPWDIYDAAPGAGAEKNPWRALIRQRIALCQAELASLGSPAPPRQ
jgi:hypothetical protein